MLKTNRRVTLTPREVIEERKHYQKQCAACEYEAEGKRGGFWLLGEHGYPSQDSNSAFQIHSLSDAWGLSRSIKML